MTSVFCRVNSGTWVFSQQAKFLWKSSVQLLASPSTGSDPVSSVTQAFFHSSISKSSSSEGSSSTAVGGVFG